MNVQEVHWFILDRAKLYLSTPMSGYIYLLSTHSFEYNLFMSLLSHTKLAVFVLYIFILVLRHRLMCP